jgi:hypothetical protein
MKELYIRQIADFGIPLGPLTEPAAMFKSKSGKILHRNQSCPVARVALLPYAARLDKVAPERLCDQCVTGYPDPAVDRYRLAALNIRSLRREVAKHESSPIASWSEVAKLRSAVALTELHLRKLSSAELAALGTEAIDMANSTIDAATPQGGIDGVLRACASRSLKVGYNSFPGHGDVDCSVLTQVTSSYQRDQVPKGAWSAWLDAIASGENFASAAVQAQAAASSLLGPEPELFTQVPQDGALDPSGFDSPRAWVQASWEQACHNTLATLSRLWEKLTLEQLDKPDALTVGLVSLRPYRPEIGRGVGIEPLLAPFPLHVNEGSHSAVARMPQVVAERIRVESSATRLSVSQHVMQPGDEQLLDLALGLWSDDTHDPLGDFEAALSAARLVNCQS